MWKSASLTPAAKHVIEDRGTEAPFSGALNELMLSGSYLCRRCGLALFRATSKFVSSCGWPSYDAQIADHVKKVPDADGMREEILCTRCEAHLGHVFYGEGLTEQNTRYCVNSISIDFVMNETVQDTQEVILAAGCFWGVEYLFKQFKGVLKTEVGYSGGELEQPNYQAICRGDSGHYEAIRIVFDPTVTTLTKIFKYFFEIHNFEQDNGQGPDVGQQYLSVIFYYNDKQRFEAERLIGQLKTMGYQPSTSILPVATFWPAEDYHQDYYHKQHKQPYCHQHRKIF